MVQQAACPSADVLASLLGGKLSEPQLHELATHLESCPACQERARTLAPQDTLVDVLREPSADAGAIANEIPRALVDRLKQLSQRSAATADTVGFPGKDDAADEDDLAFLSAPQQDDEIGRLGPYRILKVLGQGGMGVVFLADDPKLERRVALKVMLPKIAARPSAKQRFLREASAAAKLRSDHIVTIYQVEEANGVPYIAMELLDGCTLDERLHGGAPLPLAEILRIGREVAQGLSVAHEKGLLHRDIKPANLWLDQAHDGRVKILDFGLARAEKENVNLTQSGAVVGTPAYMAPEQARGDKDADARVDLFSLGCVLYRLCAGEVPFKGETTMGVLMALAMHDPAPPAQVNATIPQELSELVMQLLAKEPAKRPASAKVVLARLSALERTLGPRHDQAEAITLPSQPAVREAAPARARMGMSRWLALALAVLFIGVIASSVYQLIFDTPLGRIIVQIDDDDIDARFKKGKLELYDKEGKLLYTLAPSERGKDLPAGQYGIKVVGADGVELNTDKFEMKRGGEVVVRVLLDRAAQAKKDVPDKQIHPESPMKADATSSLRDILTSAAWEWTAPADLGAKVNFSPGNCAPTLSADGRILIIFNEHEGKAALWESRRDQPSVKPTRVQAPGMEGLAKIWDPCLSADGLTLYFLGRGPATRDKVEVLATQRTALDRPWGKVESMDERWKLGATPWGMRLSADGRVLVFINSDLRGHGKSDLWLCQRDSAEKPFGPPVNLGPEINTADLEMVFALAADGCTLLFLRGEASPQLWLSSRPNTAAPFGPAVKMQIPKASFALNPAGLSGDGRTLIFTAPAQGYRLVMTSRVPADPDRRAAEYVLSGVGRVKVSAAGKEIDATQLVHLPAQPFLLLEAELYQQATDAGLANFQGCKHLTRIHLLNPKITDAGLVHFQHCENLTCLSAVNAAIGDAGLAHFKRCKQLTVLNLTASKVTDAGLAHFKDCKKITVLDLNSTKVTDAGLAHFKDCKELAELILTRTAVTDAGLAHFNGSKFVTHLKLDILTEVGDAGLANFKDCKYMTVLHLQGAQVTDKGLAYLANFKYLTQLSLHGCTQVTDAGLAHLKKCEHLEVLFVGSQQGAREGLIQLKDLRKLKVLHMHGPKVTDASLAELKHHANLRELHLPYSQVSDTGLKQLADCKQLSILGLLSTPVSDAGLEHLMALAELRLLDLNETKVTLEGAKKLHAKLPQCVIYYPGGTLATAADIDRRAAEYVLSVGDLVIVNVAGKQMTFVPGMKLPTKPFQLEQVVSQTVTDAGLASFQGCRNLTALNLAHNQKVTDAGLAYFKDCQNLATLSLAYTKISDAGLAHFKDCRSLETLNLGYTTIGDAGLAHLRECKKITNLNLAITKTTDAGLAHFKDCQNLTELDLDRCVAVTDAGLANFAGSKFITRLGLNGLLKIGDAGFANFKACKFLTFLALTNTQVTDKGLAQLQGCKYLTDLNLSGSLKLTGASLSHLKGCTQLETLSLGGLQVTPEGLAHLKELPKLKLFYMAGGKMPPGTLAQLKLHYPVLGAVNLSGTPVNEADLKQLATWQALTELNLAGSGVTDAALAHLGECKNLATLTASSNKISDLGIAHLKRCSNLTYLRLAHTEFSDAGLESLHGLGKLNFLDVLKTRCTQAGVKKLAAALPQCEILWDGGLIAPQRAADADRRAAEWALSLGASVRLFGDFIDRRGIADLPKQPFRLTEVGFLKNGKVTDTDLAHLKDCSDLRFLDLTGTPTTDAGLVHFNGHTKLTYLGLSDTKVTDAGLAHFKDCKQLEGLGLTNTNVGDVGLANFKNCQGLIALALRNTAVSDQSLAFVKSCQNLTHLDLRGTKVSAAGIDELKKALPQCKIEWDGGTIEPQAAATRRSASAAGLPRQA